jgi:hypothetical protein
MHIKRDKTMKELIKRYTSRKALAFISAISLVLISAIGITVHKNTLFFPGHLSAKGETGVEIEGFVSHAEFEQECGHCHGPIHCVQDSRCQDCHFEVAQERATATGLHGRLPGIKQCETCHSEHLGREARITYFAYNNVNHTLLADFSLEKHRFDYDNQPMGCQSCHSQDSFISEKLDCITCHANEDHDFIANHIELYSTDCISCHDGTGNYGNFNHAEYFPLEGKHEDLACESCHQEKQFAGTPQECASCHQEPEMHAGIFGLQCERCHTATAWYPAALTRHTFVVDHGVEVSPTCETCHLGTCTEYRCSSCHDDHEMEVIHHEEGIYTTHDCVECHPVGKEADNPQTEKQKSKNETMKTSGTFRKIGVRAAMLTTENPYAVWQQQGSEPDLKGSIKHNIHKNTGSVRGGS